MSQYDFDETVNKIICLIVFLVLLFFVTIPFGQWISSPGEPQTFTGYMPSVSTYNNRPEYRIYTMMDNRQYDKAFATEDINEFYKACEYFKVRIDPGVPFDKELITENIDTFIKAESVPKKQKKQKSNW